MRRGHRFVVDVGAGRTGVIRDARPSDAREALASVARVVRERPRTLLIGEDELWTPKQWREHRLVWCPDGAWLAAELDGRFVGLYVITRGARRAERHKAEFGVWLVPEARGLGFGRAMLEAGEIWAKEHGVTRVELGVFASNRRARRVYLSAGYEEEGLLRAAYTLPEGETIDAIRMAKLL